ncbi:hypothetical protein SAMN05216474_2625 [Lishizhenia tianjinensis]|uniref:Lysylphosphatidylglycerol synthase TM region n=1 Tax=Lishizhenia tianjinensis TaxID=477690 RepID=A0A1I7BAV4_9FLAO|nr:lysylphosphatidylglycerol synthase transmembrane domain-containing protein [Lishizhenia tianjinensis]SFT84202.1 hypothetical protein SAMN05216474_2625 [Lishizhenia tianjinensis]
MTRGSFNIEQLFNGKRVFIPIVLGLAIVVFMLYRSLSKEQFIVDAEKGTHAWVDSNANQKVDLSLPEEFVLSEEGNYRISTPNDLLRDVHFNGQAIFWLIMAFVCMVIRDLAYMLRIRILTKKFLSWRRSFFVIMIWEFASALSPGVVGGSAVAMFILNREGVKLGKSTAIIVVTTLMDNLVFVFLIPLVLIFIPLSVFFDGNANLLTSFFWIGYAIITGLSLFLFLSIFIWPNIITSLLRLMMKIPFLKRWRKAAVGMGNDIKVTAKEMQGESLSHWLKAFGATLLSWFGRYAVINCILQAFVSISLMDHVQILGKQLILWLVMMVSITPGGSGIAEYAFSELLAGFGASMLLLAVLAIIWRLISYFPYLFIGVYVLPNWLRSTQQKKK